MLRKKKLTIRIIALLQLLVISSSLMSCRQSLFNMLTNNGVGYWVIPGDDQVQAYSKKDSVLEYLNGNLKTRCVYLMRTEKFRISEDTINHAYKYRGQYYYYDTLLIVPYSKNLISFVDPQTNYTIYYRRIKKKEAKQRKNGTYVEKYRFYPRMTVDLTPLKQRQAKENDTTNIESRGDIEL